MAEPMMEMVSSMLNYLFTPTGIFCVLNLMIGTIYITSRISKLHHGNGGGGGGTANHYPAAAPPPPRQQQLARAPSLLDRPQEPEVEEEPEVHHHDDDRRVAMGRSKSATAAAAAAYMEAPAERMRKSASEKAVVEQEKPKGVVGDGRTTAAVGEDEAVDERADDFINRFRQQLKLQRLDSILRYKEMLSRGAGR
ncbi:OLC1v1037719C1 [Oldenlandia corymbosa var. corymbosa]|uniref:OLC1v1037719C1 n=1 Tax=Oldenlandia corymbosa var. corymbosa TaxID=529605 RepID=A0AAV1D097_OLDCO|nr:OLC1v1037719C1 [Oldenlandia corymbosa var. corymbosa]